MRTRVGALVVVSFALLTGHLAFGQSIPPSRITGPSAAVTEYLHIFSCYDAFTGNMLDCQVTDELHLPDNDPASRGGHTHGGTFPLTDLAQGPANGFVCAFCTDFNLDPLVIQTRTNSAGIVINHRIPQFSGRIRVSGSTVPPPNWFCITTCNFSWIEDVGVDGLATLPTPGPHHRVVVTSGTDALHPIGYAGTSDTIAGVLSIADSYFQLTGRGLSVNDLSLPRGGKYDIASNDSEGGDHISHRNGKDADFNTLDLGGQSTNCFSDKDYKQILQAHNLAYDACHPGGAYHVRFR